jgi:uncharacterized protein (DUF433 family)
VTKIDVLRFPYYSARDAARYTRLPYSTVLYWTRGRPGHPPVIRAKHQLSFLELVEIHMLGVFRRYHRVPLQKLRRVLTTLAKRYPDEAHPLATRRFWLDGRSVFTEELGDLVSLSEPGQLALRDVVELYAKRVEWGGSTPRRLFLFTTRPELEIDAELPKSIVIDPAVAYGQPVVAGTRITADVLFGRFEAGETVEALADDYGITLQQVQDAIRCGKTHAAA